MVECMHDKKVRNKERRSQNLENITEILILQIGQVEECLFDRAQVSSNITKRWTTYLVNFLFDCSTISIHVRDIDSIEGLVMGRHISSLVLPRKHKTQQ